MCRVQGYNKARGKEQRTMWREAEVLRSQGLAGAQNWSRTWERSGQGAGTEKPGWQERQAGYGDGVDEFAATVMFQFPLPRPELVT